MEGVEAIGIGNVVWTSDTESRRGTAYDIEPPGEASFYVIARAVYACLNHGQVNRSVM